MIFYDVETQFMSYEVEGGWDNVEAFLFGSAVTYDTKSDLYKFWDKNQKDELVNYLHGNLCVSFNGKFFDNKVLLGNDYNEKELQWVSYDLKEEITKQVFNVLSMEYALELYHPSIIHGGYSLDGICGKTFGLTKNNNTFVIPEMIRNNNWKVVFEYNLHDVRMTKMLLKHITTEGWIRNGYGGLKKIKISKKIWEM